MAWGRFKTAFVALNPAGLTTGRAAQAQAFTGTCVDTSNSNVSDVATAVPFRSRWFGAVLCVVTLLSGVVAAPPAHAQTFRSSFVGTSGATETATAAFSLTSGTLTLVLTNTSTFTHYSNADVLSGIFFAIAGNPILTPVSATASTPTTCGASCVGGNVGVNYGYDYSTSGFKMAVGGATFASGAYGIGAPGYSSLTPGMGGTASFSPGNNHANGQGLKYSIVGPDFTSIGGSNTPLVQDSVTFKWTVPSGVTSLSISNVIMAYGTAPDASHAATAPEPSSLALLAAGVLGLVRVRRKFRPARGASPTQA